MTCFWLLLGGFLFCMVVLAAGGATVSIVPRPVRLTRREGCFNLTRDTVIVAGGSAVGVGRQLSAELAPATGYSLRVVDAPPDDAPAIVLELKEALTLLGKEGYRLSVDPGRVVIEASKEAGLFYAVQTVRQLLPTEIFHRTPATGVAWTMPCVEIEDYPRFSWRGVMLDSCRHFMPTEFVKKMINLAALHKMNVFHWHLTEDQGWRIEIKKYPRLTEIGAWRDETFIGHSLSDEPARFDGVRHGGFYTQDDIREIVSYAQERCVTVVPEIEMPGHSQAAIAAYPELGNTAAELPVYTQWGINENILSARESTIVFMQNVLSEVLELFPSEFIHIGGDEAPKQQWEQSSEMQDRIRELGLKDENELQSYFIRRMEQLLAGRGRRLIGWDEIAEGGLAPGAAVMSWRGEQAGIDAAKAGHDVVMAPHEYTYLDSHQVDETDQADEPLAIGGYLPQEKVYRYDPVPADMTQQQARHILGAQGQIWTEYIPTPSHAEYMAFPRACALCEAIWTCSNRKDYDDFLARMNTHLKRLDILDVNYRPFG